jgi:hypothetical protein
MQLGTSRKTCGPRAANLQKPLTLL